MFRITDICNIAVQIEHNGEKCYRRAAKEATDPEIAEIFRWMADEEKRHANWFASLASDTPVPPEHEELEAMGRSLLQDMVASQTFSLDQEKLNQVTSLNEMLGQSVTFEEDTILFYEFLRNIIDDEDTGRQLDIIIAEERRHAEQLAEMATVQA